MVNVLNSNENQINRIKELLAEKGNMKAYVHSFGCQLNVSDGEKIKGLLKKIGYTFTEDTSEADLIILNTCAVRENAEDRVLGIVGSMKHLKELKPDLIIGISGCMTAQEHVVERIKKSYPQVDFVLGTSAIHSLPTLLLDCLNGERFSADIAEYADFSESQEQVRESSYKASVPIMFGCNNFCTYCIVPYVRGRERSRKAEEIIKEVKGLAADGYKEIMLLGQNVNSYGKGLPQEITFADLLRKVNEIEGLERIRFMTSHPKDLSDELIRTMAESKKVCHHLHLPMQSGSSRILKIMNRRYDKEKYLELVAKIRNAVPDISLTTDIIVGFPGETEEDFQDTLDVVEKCDFDSAFTFIYSKRSGTPAAKMENQVPEDVVKDRFDRLLALVQEKGRKASSRFEGTVQEILVEEESREKGIFTGRTEYNLLVHFPGCQDLIGKYVKVKLDTCKGFYYFGSLAE